MAALCVRDSQLRSQVTFPKIGANERVDPSDFISGIDDEKLQFAMEATRGADTYDLLNDNVCEVGVDNDVIWIDCAKGVPGRSEM